MSPPPTCQWLTWQSAWRNLWVNTNYTAKTEMYTFSFSSVLNLTTFYSNSNKCNFVWWMHFVLFLTGQIRWHQEGRQGCSWRTHEGHPGIHRAPGIRLSLLPDLGTVCRSVFSLTSLSLSCRSSPQTSTVTATPPSLMLALASPSTTTLSSWSHGTPSSWIAFKSKYLLSDTYWLLSLVS